MVESAGGIAEKRQVKYAGRIRCGRIAAPRQCCYLEGWGTPAL